MWLHELHCYISYLSYISYRSYTRAHGPAGFVGRPRNSCNRCDVTHVTHVTHVTNVTQPGWSLSATHDLQRTQTSPRTSSRRAQTATSELRRSCAETERTAGAGNRRTRCGAANG